MGLGGGRVAKEHEAGGPVVDAHARYVLAVLFCVYLSNHIDRQILMILLEPIKKEFGVSDFMMGFLSGPTFALFYTCLGIPIARLADRSSRRRIVVISLAVWSAMTALSGAARSFWALAAFRVGVGAGEAGCSPPSHSLIADYFPAASRARALGIYVAGGQAGAAFGWLLGGWLFYWLGWRLTFVIVGVPGLLLALLVALSVREPQRGGYEGGDTAPLPFRDAFAHLLRQRSYVWLQAGSALHAVAGYGLAVWVAPFLMRVHGLELQVIGTWLGLIALCVGIPGMFLGGFVADKLVPRDPRWYLWIPTLSAVLATPFTIGFLFLGNPTLALCAWIGHTLIMMTHSAPGAAMTQTVIKVRARSLAVAVHMFVGNLIGLGLGPVAIGAMNDALRASYGDLAIRYTMLVAVITNVVACIFYLIGARSVRRDIAERDGL
jgi:predicted MFS family arabinose efflux permease